MSSQWFAGHGGRFINAAVVPAKTLRIVPFVEDEDLIDWDLSLDHLPPPTACGTITVDLVPLPTEAQDRLEP